MIQPHSPDGMVLEELCAGTGETGRKMRKRYVFVHLSRSEREFLEAVLAEEVEIQTWYAVSWSRLLAAELFVGLQ